MAWASMAWADCTRMLFLPVDIQDGETPKLGYAEGTTVVEDPDALQKAVDEMYAHAAEGGVTLEYKNDARSTDGENFSCYIANAAENRYDMYLQIFADSELTDQLLLTGLIRPGSAFDNISLEQSVLWLRLVLVFPDAKAGTDRDSAIAPARAVLTSFLNFMVNTSSRM